MESVYLMSLRAFGDFVIESRAARAVRKPGPGVREVRVLTGEHARPLARALGIEDRTFFIKSEPRVPAAFDIRVRGPRAMVRSLFELRRQLQSLQHSSRMVFHDYEWRAKLIAAPQPACGLAAESNIYLAFEKTLRELGCELETSPEPRGVRAGSTPLVRIFPSARAASRCLPPDLISHAWSQATAAGARFEVICLKGETQPLPGFPSLQIDRTFDALIDAIRASDVVITPDSLPSHLADYLGVPVFVFSPIQKQYWLPRSCFLESAWALFDNHAALGSWLAGRLHSPSREDAM